MASVFLRFTPPDAQELRWLRIYEATTADGNYTLIEQVDLNAIGATYPDYISEYETDQATGPTNWFAISWVGEKGAETDRSNPIQGGTESLVGEIVSLVNERDSNLDDQVVRQEVEFAIETYFNADPYTVSTDSYRVKVGLARLVQARTMMSDLASGSSSINSGWTAGLVSMKSGSTSSQELISWLLKMAAEGLGLSTGRIAQMAQMPIAGGLSTYNGNGTAPVLIEVE